MTTMTTERPPSVDKLARQLATASTLPHPLLVEVARAAISAKRWDDADADAAALERLLLTPVVNATGVLLHTNLVRCAGLPEP
jgi:L-seryl-tRNA(Ser) seleniumtransferase